MDTKLTGFNTVNTSSPSTFYNCVVLTIHEFEFDKDKSSELSYYYDVDNPFAVFGHVNVSTTNGFLVVNQFQNIELCDEVPVSTRQFSPIKIVFEDGLTFSPTQAPTQVSFFRFCLFYLFIYLILVYGKIIYTLFLFFPQIMPSLKR